MINRKHDYGLFWHTAGPLAVVRSCKWCSHRLVLYRAVGGGRGYGMREGNKDRGQMIQHVKANHPAEYAAYREEESK